ncbi:hypothetical protein JCM5353_009064, partial [Sporobolomyces roseus]
RQRLPPPIEYRWAPSALSTHYRYLPPLPAISDPQIARQAVTSKDFLISSKGLSDSQIYDHEIDSYRPLEWLGDGKLHQAYSEGLSRLLPGFSAGVLSIMRDRIETNTTQSYLGWSFDLDSKLLEPPSPSKPRVGWRPLAHSQKIVSDLFEAHVGALVKEGRQAEIDHWVDELFQRNSVDLRNQADALAVDHREKTKESRSELRKRNREENLFEVGREIDPVTKVRRHSLLTQCPVEPLETGGIPRWRWHDRTDPDGKWHSHFVSDNTTIACGRGHKQAIAHDTAVAHLLESLGENEELRTYLLDLCIAPVSAKRQQRNH